MYSPVQLLYANKNNNKNSEKATLKKSETYLAALGKIGMVWVQDQASQNDAVSQILIQSKALSFNSVKADRDEEDAEEQNEASRG
jgi:hypothetical protein